MLERFALRDGDMGLSGFDVGPYLADVVQMLLQRQLAQAINWKIRVC
jgi:hypothetical protein